MKNTTPKEAIEKLVEGNRRFTTGLVSVETLLSKSKMSELAQKGQRPFAIVLTCSDSRSPVEMIFDQGLGDIFVVRVAGNVVAPSLLASIEFAAANFGSATVVVLGHTQCGAVNAALQQFRHPETPLPSAHLEELISRIRPAVDSVVHKKGASAPNLMDAAIVANILRSRELILEQSKIVSSLVSEGKLSVEPAILDISTGSVRFLEVH
ncbi:MAG: carbonic anhydrase [Bdellovibrionales bacterium CG10_big_fil_rev_8_21_14_0_10_45_34]|nr:MAG: carbonic anhydrase [Bdellovibrionales bacterium CG10_big_fil_rev_8_21_14_0_10_45_34]